MNEEKELNSTNEYVEETNTEETNIEETDDTEEVQQENSEQQSGKDPKQSWRELSEKAEALQKERDEYHSMLKQIYQASLQKQQEPKGEPQEEYFDYNSIDDDDLPDGKTIKRVLKSEQNKRQQLEKYIRDQQQIQYENQIKNELNSKFGDFDNVVNQQNINKLREMRPGLARSLHSNPDLREKAIETYYSIKDLGIYEPSSYAHDRERIKKNVSKPRSTQSLGGRESSDPLSYANAFSEGLTEELKRKLYETAKKKAGRI